jgi:hypothetical protein
MFARFSLRTKASEIILAQYSSHMTMPASRPMSTKATIIPRTILDFAFWIDVQESTFFLVTSIESRVEIAFWHFGHIIFV